jgi:RNA-directed DNA polymerase
MARGGRVTPRVARNAQRELKERVRRLTGRNRGRSMAAFIAELRSYLDGWKQYFGLAQTPRALAELDGWIRRRLRCVQLKQWKNGRTIFRELRVRGAPEAVATQVAAFRGRWWAASSAAGRGLPNTWFDAMGLPRLAS